MIPAIFFSIGFAGGFLYRAGGPAYQLFTVPLLIITGLPLPTAVGSGILLNAAGKLKLIYHPEITRHAYKRLGMTLAILSLPFMVTGKQLLLRLSTLPAGAAILVFIYSTVLVITALIAARRYRHYCQFGYEDENPLPPGGLFWRYPLATPGLPFPKYITVGRVSLVGGSIGLCTGLAGLNTRALLEPLLMYLTGLSRRQARATASFTLYLIGAFAAIIFLPDLSTFSGARLTFMSLGAGYLAGYIYAWHLRREKLQNPEESIFLAWWGLSSAVVLLGSRAASLAPFYTTALMFGSALVTMLGFTLISLCQVRWNDALPRDNMPQNFKSL
ncbi:sulfite exporter TauE/SafE family protein [Desulfofundulus salinus]|uniref:Probable membrane transporter protein n=1 Tax=Desulfofundulus salinus TaxID=2419843 RepID=A0A494WVR8_9FIRM|nr:sulfite exporter TauE/SafE family protein [Desulfofundulus salinum]RKO66302.1 sulfite exporter TauE/SafE family protein [Desulfofundulus salinum]